ncbi:hypothetical protein L1987_04362 [Smallanthus sonchifolius]|uniref:Uncharacterized protein n=1 Tax=Smallanthus sonchifolius TaxID=185202 RepID=A0ACB9KDD0_9ASTR|nr:hypothetical protein L1987_04362 [Smallanthus sonchifolius]
MSDSPSVSDSTCEQEMGLMSITDNKNSQDLLVPIGDNDLQNSAPLISLLDYVHPTDATMNVEKLMKMAGAVRTGGRGSVRRKKKAVHKTTTTDDKRLQSTLKRIGVNAIPSIEEVNIFKDETVIQFLNPKVQASIGANTWVVSGSPQTKKLQDILPGIINQLGPDNLDNLRKLAEQFQKQASAGSEGAPATSAQEDDDEVPELVAVSTSPITHGLRSSKRRHVLTSVLMNVEKLMKMAGAVRTGGKGSVRRKKKAVHKTTTTDDKRLQSTLKRIGVNSIPSIEEVNIFKDETVIQFLNPKVQASIGANTWVVNGSPQTKKLQDILPGIFNQLGPDNLDNLRKLAEQFQKQAAGGVEGAAAASAQEDDDEVPELVAGETFEAAAEEGQKS